MNDEHPKRRVIDNIDFERANDEEWNPDAEVSSHKMLYAIYKDVQEMKAKLASMEDMFVVWTNTKGFITTIRLIGRVLLWLAIISGTLAGMWYAFKKAVNGL